MTESTKFHGNETFKLAKELIQIIKDKCSEIELFFDNHTNPAAEYKEHATKPKMFFGLECHDSTTLSFVDIVLKRKKKIELICEIEESKCTPKPVIGDVFSILLSDHISIKSEPYAFENTKVYIGFIPTGPIKRINDLEVRINLMIEKCFKKGISVKLITGNNRGEMIETLKNEIIKLI